MSHLLSSAIRHFRNNDQAASDAPELSSKSEVIPFVPQEQIYSKSADLEYGAYSDPCAGKPDLVIPKLPIVINPLSLSNIFHHVSACFLPAWHWKHILQTPISPGSDGRARVYKDHILEGHSYGWYRTSPLRKALSLFVYSLMLLGLLHSVILACGLLVSFFPDIVDDELASWELTESLSNDLVHWPTDFSADVHAVACHSHNDYWRKEPLFSALQAGCTGVEADVWLYDQDLYVGHSTAALTPERTLRSLYIDPLMKILDQQNPITSFHPSLDLPPNGVFDTKPNQTLVLLIDFKNEGQAIWPYVSDQLDPLREKGYLTYFNGSDVIDGPVTVVVTGNAPFNAVVASSHYRDMFFDAPLALMEKLSDMTPLGAHAPPQGTTIEDVQAVPIQRSTEDQGQGLSGAAPLNPAIYSRANAYYASVSFQSTIGWPWRGRLSSGQIERIRKQVAGAHSRGLKVRYWGVPSWPRGMRNYLWQTLVQEGVDYLNVDDLKSATQGAWGWGEKKPWFDGLWPRSSATA